MDEFNNTGNQLSSLERQGNALFIIFGWISAVISLFAYPFIFGVIGVILGILSSRNGSRAGLFLIAGSIILMGLGLAFSGVMTNYTRQYLGI